MRAVNESLVDPDYINRSGRPELGHCSGVCARIDTAAGPGGISACDFENVIATDFTGPWPFREYSGNHDPATTWVSGTNAPRHSVTRGPASRVTEIENFYLRSFQWLAAL